MSPEKNKKLKKLRLDLDKIDDKLIKVIKKRFRIVKSVLLLKTKKKEIIDKKRIKIILNNIKKKSLQNKIDIKITNRIWKNMIWAFIDYEFRNIKKNKK
ncbi:MAG: chorismate mutase [Candidatus Pelagibacter sp. TMED273]|nr:MAG: chorismate mutase [Candidatus Pelagibacter sp. TMED273]|tara:strand:+ start:882 stop:1178 length:297 start_codon:yes stop_codon:yes gene_type:complete